MKNYLFVVRSRNEERWIGHTIQSIVDNFANPEIVVVDNESTDNTLDVVKLFINDRRKIDLKIVSLPRIEYTPGRAINLGVNSSNNLGEDTIICVLSSHCVIKNFDKVHVESLLSKNECCAIFGRQIPVYQGKKLLYRYVWENFSHDVMIKNPIENIEEKRPFFHNAFSFINYTDWKKTKFDEECMAKEDRVWIAEMINKGMHCYYTPNISCYHHWTTNGATWKGQG